MRTSTKWALVGIGLLALSAMAVGVILVLALSGTHVPGRAVLVVNASGDLPDHDMRSAFEQALGGEVDTLMDTVDSIERAGNDRRVQAVFLKIGDLQTGLAKVVELRQALADFRASGKPVYAFVETIGTSEYYLASVSDEVFLSPGGMVMVTGLLADSAFYKGTLEKLKIRAEMEHIGEYKSASDVWTRDSMSEAQREATTAILDSFYGRIVDDIAASRKMLPTAVRAAIDAGFMTPKEAKESGLVDELLYEDQAEAALRKKVGEYSELRVSNYKKGGGLHLVAGNRVAVVNAIGTIVSGKGGSSPFGGAYIGSTTFSRLLRDLRDDDGIKAVVMRVDSPGGSGVASDVIWREEERLRAKKPLIISMGDVAGSGGYYIAMGADAIVAQPTTITGSIGVISGKFNMRGFYDEWLGMHRDQIKRGENADILSDYQGFTDAQRDRLRRQIRAFYDDFVSKAAKGRKKTDAEIEKIARGRIWSGADAQKLGLVDELGGLRRAVEIARERAGIGPSESVSIEVYPRRKTLFQALSEDEDVFTRAVKVPEPFGRVLSDLEMRRRVACDGIVLWTGEF